MIVTCVSPKLQCRRFTPYPLERGGGKSSPLLPPGLYSGSKLLEAPVRTHLRQSPNPWLPSRRSSGDRPPVALGEDTGQLAVCTSWYWTNPALRPITTPVLQCSDGRPGYSLGLSFFGQFFTNARSYWVEKLILTHLLIILLGPKMQEDFYINHVGTKISKKK